MKPRLLFALALLIVVLMAVVYGQSKTRGPAPPPIPASAPMYPLIGIDVPDMTWSELAAMIAVLAGISGGFQWILTRAIVQPQIEKSIKFSTQDIMRTCLETFATKYQFGLHENGSKLEHEAIGESIQEIVKHMDTENARLTDVRERVRVLEARRG